MKKRYFILAGIFLFNPVISIFDLLPDFIGYFLIMKAFSDASYVYDNASETHDAFKKMGIISLFKLVCMVILPSTDATMALVFSFTFAILEIMYGLGAVQRLFDATSFICLRCGEDRFVPKSEKLKLFTVVFLIVKVVCATIPDFFTLFLSDPANAWKARFRGLIFVFTAVIALIVGIIWLVRFISFFRQTLTENVREKIKVAFTEEMKDRQTVFFSKDFIFAIGIMIISLIFTIDFYVDKIEVFSDILLAPIFLIAIIFLRKKGHISIKKYELLLILSIVGHFISAILNTVFYSRFINEYISTSVLNVYASYMTEAQRAYLPVKIFTICEAIFFLAIVILSLYLIRKYAIQRIVENPRFFSELSVEGYLKEFSAISLHKCKLAGACAIASSACSIIYTFVVSVNEAFVVFNMCVAILFYVLYIHALSYTRDEIFKKILKYS